MSWEVNGQFSRLRAVDRDMRLDEAIDLLHEAIPSGNSYLMYVGSWGIYDPLRSHPRYEGLLSDLGLN